MKKLIPFALREKKENSIVIDVRRDENGDRVITVNENGKVTEMVNPRLLTMNDLRGTVMLGWEDKACHIRIRQYKGSRAEQIRQLMSGRNDGEILIRQELMMSGTAQPIGA